MSNFHVPNIALNVVILWKYPGTIFSCVTVNMLSSYSKPLLLCSATYAKGGNNTYL